MTRSALIFGAVLVLAACDVVTSEYRSVAEARADRLFERGWLPDILPASANSIRVASNLDTNSSEGRFWFTPADYASFRAVLLAEVPETAPFHDWSSFLDSKASAGYAAHGYRAKHYHWVFLCNPDRGYCEYRGWYVRGAA